MSNVNSLFGKTTAVVSIATLVPDEWVRPPANWAKSGIQQGKTCDLGIGEGNRILCECMERATGGLHYWNIEADPRLVAGNFARYGAAAGVRPRLGQGLFSLAVRDAYLGACAVTREHSLPALEAAHIQPYVQGGEPRVDNGLLLRSDLHRLCDAGLGLQGRRQPVGRLQERPQLLWTRRVEDRRSPPAALAAETGVSGVAWAGGLSRVT